MIKLIGSKNVGTNTRTYGAIAIILGVLAMLAPVVTGVSVSVLLGLLVMTAGVVRLRWAFQAERFGKGLPSFAIGGLTLLCGILLVVNPLFLSRLLTIILAAYFIFDGIIEIASWNRLRSEAGRGWLLFGGIASLLLGALIWAQYPLSGAWAMGVLLGIKLVFVGITMVMGVSAGRFTEKG